MAVATANRAPLGALVLLMLSAASPALVAQTFERGPTHSPHGPLSIPCSSCHTEKNWKTMRAVPEFNHNTQTAYPLRGMHEGVKCSLCHTKLVFKQTSTQCADCHADIHRRQFGADCAQCHTVKGWTVAVQNIRDHLNRFPLLGAHAMVECDACHTGAASGQFTGLSTACESCHMRDFNRTTAPAHVAAGFSTACGSCHNMDTFLTAKFDHSTTGFPLVGAHATLPCEACHVSNRFKGTPSTCIGCHNQDFIGAKDPNHVQSGFSTDCAACHTMTSWAGARFDHSTTKFPLTGAHVNVACDVCHVNGQFAGLPMTCISCHLKDEQGTSNPNHVAAGFPQDCSICHTTVKWSGAAFDHTTQTKFPLTGAHVRVACTSCHVNNVFAGLSMSCASCHLKDFQGASNPNHVAAGFPQDCSVCHTTVDWSGAAFNHTTMTKFPLTGAHVNVACNACHVNNVFAGLSMTCVSCHLKDFQDTTNPNHVTGNFSQDCQLCHTTADWTNATFDHNKTSFPLTGAHISVACATCHVNNVFAGLSTACISCHLKDEQGTTNPNHVTAGFPQDCSMCHTTTNWDGATFNHNTQTKFPLAGAHVNVPCATCHVNNVFAGLSTACISCHLKDEQGTTNPNHIAAGFPQDCSVCHTVVDWTGATFNHNTQTKFPLSGAHVSVACATCHVNNVFAGLSTACVSCHLKDEQGTTDPNHVAAGFPQDCSVCHTTLNWSGAAFNHTTQTKFPLTGAHINVPCATCHVNNLFAGLSTACVSCHLKDFQGTTNPNHVAGGISQDCQICHTTTNWDGAVFDHNKTAFPLTGAHVNVQCATCHVNNVFAGLATACISCHLKDEQGTTNPNHVTAGFPQDCSMCHTTVAWTGANFNHTTQTKFPLTGAHTNVACATCHVNNVFAGLSMTCISCHLKDEQGTTNPNHVAAGFPQDCSTCHTTTNWLGATFNHTTQTKFPLTGAHVSVACATCHVNNVFAGLSTACISCHLKDEQGTTDPNHVAAGFPQDCSTCHTTTNWLGATFNHTTQTKFPLTGAHVSVACTTCHVNNVFAGLSTTCISCHLKDEQGATNPNHVAAGFPQDCSTCHTTTNWDGATFNHTTQTKFPLTGAHINVACATCHVNDVFAGLSTACITCHLKDEQGATNPNHISAGFPQDCSMCHTTTNWDGATFNHTTQTKFPLTGAHVSVPCATCHVSNVFAGLSMTCVSCHLKDFQGTTNPNHVAGGISQDCQICHSTINWDGAQFDHGKTAFPLTGAHVNVQCAACHVNNVFAGLSTACVSCHLKDEQGATNPNHVAAGFPSDCSMCHTTTNWLGATFNHTTQTKFPLTGAHINVPCATCHVNNVFAGLSMTCVSCHLKDEQGTTNPNHIAAGFPSDCSMCHTTTNWLGATFNHTTQTKFPLTGAHINVPCATCHVNNVFAGLSMTCVSCHLKDEQGTTNPNHVAAGFPTDCSTCHTTTNWDGATFNHTTQTKFPLTGAHVSVACSTCHVNNVFAGLSMTCVSCHLKDEQGTTDPNHIAAGFPTDCSTCHTTTNWQGATFNHTTQTKFPLTGAHTSVACATCHVNNVFAGLSTACISCHLKDWQGANDPNHVAAAFPQTCDTCHTTTNWLGATFNHTTQTKFPLTGAHVGVDCNVCHVNNVYAGLSTACITCHLKDEQGTTNPNHIAGGFPTDCSMCHSTTNWLGATFNHNNTPFPLTGAHVSVACATCHVNNVFAGLSMTCISCHLKDWQGANDPNHVAAAFPQTCDTCHTTTNWLGATFNHTTQTKFPLTGAHTSVDCNVCHVNNVFAGLSTACIGCHLKDEQGTTNPNHIAGGFPQDCSMCHTTTNWDGATFNHTTQTKFPLTGAHVNVACATCHVNNVFAGLSTACISCHLKDWQGANDPNHVAAAFPQTCDTCHTTTNWLGATFNHTTQTTFPLTGAHISVDCNVCHVNNVFKGLSTACINCHLKDEQGTTNPNHIAGGFPTDCSMCHTTTNWDGASFNHTTQTKFPLTGAHVNVACATCHVNNVFAGLSMACISCHLKDWQGANDPNHVAAAFPQTCDTCHTTTNWLGATFNHTTQTKFPLTGAHTSVDCNVCHVNNVYAGLSTACVSCHLKDYTGTTDPNHPAAAFAQTCDSCHTTTNWLGATFNHTTATKFPLTGAHVSLDCNLCHVNNVYAGLSMACYSCHVKDFTGATNPNHVSAGFPQDCTLCHTTTNWTGATFNHNNTPFPLTGAHVNVLCATCHVNNVYAGLPMTCISCHLKDWQGTTDPNHTAAAFPQTCDTCHSTTNWSGATFNHTTQTTFPLTGAHTSVDCNVCHVSNVFKGLSTACYSCHQSDFTGTNSPNHVSAGFPQDCSLCHSTTNWSGATFDHSKTPFPLTGAHVNVACATCHVNNVFAGLATTCISCHLKDYNGATNPNHAALGYPQDCTQCHTTTDFTSSTFNHTASTFPFPLTGAHVTVPCASCHVNGNFTTTPTDCYSCHTADYTGTTNPNHTAAGFPTTCATCHTTTAWTGATFNHTYFPMTHGNAKLCSDCHTNSNDYSVFQCTGCHTANNTNGEHSGVRNYVYNSTNCYACHPKGNGG